MDESQVLMCCLIWVRVTVSDFHWIKLILHAIGHESVLVKDLFFKLLTAVRTGWLLEFYVLATSKVITRMGKEKLVIMWPQSDFTMLSPLGDQTASTITSDTTQTYYPRPEPNQFLLPCHNNAE